MAEFVEQRVQLKFQSAIREQDFLEREASIRVFTTVIGWLGLISKIAGGLFALVILVLGWAGLSKYQDLHSATETAKQTVAQLTRQTESASSTAQENIKNLTSTAELKIANAANETQKNANSVRNKLASELGNVRQQAQTVEGEVNKFQGVRAEVTKLREDLSSGLEEVERLQKVIATQQNFVRNIYSGMRYETFRVRPQNATNLLTFQIKPLNPRRHWIYMVLRDCPIPESIQLQYHLSVQTPDNYHLVACNVLYFDWGQERQSLESQPLHVRYIADQSKTDRVKRVSLQDEKVYGDDKVLVDLNTGWIKNFRASP